MQLAARRAARRKQLFGGDGEHLTPGWDLTAPEVPSCPQSSGIAQSQLHRCSWRLGIPSFCASLPFPASPTGSQTGCPEPVLPPGFPPGFSKASPYSGHLLLELLKNHPRLSPPLLNSHSGPSLCLCTALGGGDAAQGLHRAAPRPHRFLLPVNFPSPSLPPFPSFLHFPPAFFPLFPSSLHLISYFCPCSLPHLTLIFPAILSFLSVPLTLAPSFSCSLFLPILKIHLSLSHHSSCSLSPPPFLPFCHPSL